MKTKILVGSAVCVGSATIVAILATLLASETVLPRALLTAGYLGLCSMGLFFVGLVTPQKD